MKNAEVVYKGYELDKSVRDLDYAHCMAILWGSREKNDLEIATINYNYKNSRNSLLENIVDGLGNCCYVQHYSAAKLADMDGWEKEFGPEPPEDGLWSFYLEGCGEHKWLTDEPTPEETIELYVTEHDDAVRYEIETSDGEELLTWLVDLLDFNTARGKNLLDDSELVNREGWEDILVDEDA